MMVSATDTFGGPAEEEEEEDEEEGYAYGYGFEPPNEGDGATPITPARRYVGWVAAAVAPLEDFIDEPTDPRDFYCDLQEIAEGESGSVYAAAISPGAAISKLKLPPLIKARDAEDVAAGRQVMVAIKSVSLDPAGTPKLVDVQRECSLLRGLWCEQVLGLDALYVDLVDDALWIRMELMERSLADVVGLVDAGLRIQEPRVLARFASDMLQALDYLQKHGIAHRDLRSDNLLLNSQGVLKLTDFSNAVLVTPEAPLATEPAGVLFWQAPEVRSGSYDPLKIDVWSVGATIWELAEANPPFADTQEPANRWPPVSEPALYPPSFHDFLRLCSEPPMSRPKPAALLGTSFLQKACGRPVIVQLLSRCMAIEQPLQTGEIPPTPL
ncbi:kinase-like domain-containing protein [Roridomyces roridus]|uniref:Kinase-like domain-containing protein n=1 Tax=Roridomyces roridus TaxID=1738132 RepID=A0AAD7B156_9AGAR|nr:kinase-like domain-containing protein [Roridomyces roridus]